MASLGTVVKREAVTTGWQLWISSATGEAPDVTRFENSTKITWKPGQAKKMQAYLAEAMKSGEPSDDDINVSVDLSPVLLPLVLKKSIAWIAGYTLATVLLTKLIWK